MIQESKEQQQMYNLFRSFIYIFLIVELVMHMPVHRQLLFADDSPSGLL